MTRSHLYWMVVGVVLLLVMKYGVVGLTLWDREFHPGRIEPPNLKPFARPLLENVWEAQ